MTPKTFALVLLGAWLAACRSESAGPRATGSAPPLAASATPATCKVLEAKRGTPTLDGKLDQPVWHRAARTDPFVDEHGRRPVPHTEARASWDESALYLELYVSDDELRSSDHVTVELDGGRVIEASPSGRLTCRFPDSNDCDALGVRSGLDVDGDVDSDAKEDEEWSITVAVPWRTLAPAGRKSELPVTLRRADSASGSPVREVWSRGCGVIRLAEG